LLLVWIALQKNTRSTTKYINDSPAKNTRNATKLKGKYSEVCLCAIGMDANNGMFPLGIFIYKKENWDKFLSLLALELKKHALPLIIISDRQKGLKNVVVEHFPQCNQRFCFRHMFKNLTKYWRGEYIKGHCWAATSAYRVTEFMRCIEELDKTASGVRSYLMKDRTSLWSRSSFDRVSKCDHLTNNFTESFNNFIISTMDKPVCSMVTEVSFLLMKIMYERKLKSSK